MDITISRALNLAQLSQGTVSSDFREETKTFCKSVRWVPLTAYSNVDGRGQVYCYFLVDITE